MEASESYSCSPFLLSNVRRIFEIFLWLMNLFTKFIFPNLQERMWLSWILLQLYRPVPSVALVKCQSRRRLCSLRSCGSATLPKHRSGPSFSLVCRALLGSFLLPLHTVFSQGMKLRLSPFLEGPRQVNLSDAPLPAELTQGPWHSTQM